MTSYRLRRKHCDDVSHYSEYTASSPWCKSRYVKEKMV